VEGSLLSAGIPLKKKKKKTDMQLKNNFKTPSSWFLKTELLQGVQYPSSKTSQIDKKKKHADNMALQTPMKWDT